MELDFNTAQYDSQAASGAACAGCKRPLAGQYWTAGSATVCEQCAQLVAAGPPREGRFGRALMAVLFGCGAALLGSIGYGLIIYFANVEAAIVTIGIGWLVGKAIRRGAGGSGGRWFQLLGAVLTYISCMGAYIPSIVVGLTSAKEPMPTAVAIIMAPFLALWVPFTGALGLLGTLILAFGVWRGWREPQVVRPSVAGPFELAPVQPALEAPAPQTT